ncbi:TPA: hypothetical protein ACPZUA_003904 [Yersinia enterocolitica]
MMDTTTSREDFEKHIRENFQYPTLEMEPEDGPCAGEYVDTMREEQFQLWNTAWQASRESIVVEFPKRAAAAYTEKDWEGNHHGRGRNDVLDECYPMLRSAGLTVKGD